jgi:hypothetical protein
MTDRIIRTAFHQRILHDAHSSNDTLVVDELGLNNGAVRADIAVLNGKLTGYEIKTNADKLGRLPGQVKAYNQVFDETYVVVAERHLKGAIKIISKWWGIYIIRISEDDIIQFESYRPAMSNPKRNFISIARLLWKEEALEIANIRFNCGMIERSTRIEIYKAISKVCETDELSNLVINYLKWRDAWRQYPSALSQSGDCCQPNSTHLERPVSLPPVRILPGANPPLKTLHPYNSLGIQQFPLPVFCTADNL